MSDNKINIKILDLLKSDDRSLNYLATKTGLSYSSLHKLSANDTTSISFDSLYKICKVLNCNIGDIMELKD